MNGADGLGDIVYTAVGRWQRAGAINLGKGVFLPC